LALKREAYVVNPWVNMTMDTMIAIQPKIGTTTRMSTTAHAIADGAATSLAVQWPDYWR
jgi:hypothetical protein